MTAAAISISDRSCLSVLIPFYRDDPAPLVRALDAQVRETNASVEIVLCDDGSADPGLTRALEALQSEIATPLILVTKPVNEGRAAARNALARAANGSWVLFLDADMTLPAGFVANWLTEIGAGDFHAAFGGFEAEPPESREGRVHAAIAAASDIGAASDRGRRGATAFCTSNLLVRADVMPDVPFDEAFKGWGWEDVDWAVRAAQAGRLKHVDNPAGHRGWQSVEQLLARYRDAAANYALLLRKHPELAALPGAKAARTLRAVPGQGALRSVWQGLARNEGLPLRLRALALKLWRASWAAEVIGP
ncbi:MULTISPECIES: glycosyltransferase family 2 protein [Hyphobacterium]|uniref:Glycosyltransferase family A protein n=1 Tax=Hyphobacterium vulgare TaxID=1736751 RepID=A0ABV6ZTP1_9PROT